MTVEAQIITDNDKDYITGMEINCSISEVLTITQALYVLSKDEKAHKDSRESAEELRKEIIKCCTL